MVAAKVRRSVKAHQRCPTSLCHELLLTETPIVADVPAKPRAIDRLELSAPFRSVIHQLFEIYVQGAECWPLALAELGELDVIVGVSG